MVEKVPKDATLTIKHTLTTGIKYLTRSKQMAMSQAKLAKKKAKHNLKRKNKKYNPLKYVTKQTVILDPALAENREYSDKETLSL